MILLELRRSSHGACTGKSPIERDRRRAHTDPFGAQRELVPNDFVWSVGPRFHSCGRVLVVDGCGGPLAGRCTTWHSGHRLVVPESRDRDWPLREYVVARVYGGGGW